MTRGGGGQSPVRVLFPCPSVGRVFSWEPSVWSGAYIAGGWGGSAPGAVTSTGRRPGASEAGPAAGARFAAQLWSALGNFCPPPAGPIFCEFWGFPSSSHPCPLCGAGVGGAASRGWGPSAPPHRLGPGPLRPLPARGLLGNCDLNGC